MADCVLRSVVAAWRLLLPVAAEPGSSGSAAPKWLSGRQELLLLQEMGQMMARWQQYIMDRLLRAALPALLQVGAGPTAAHALRTACDLTEGHAMSSTATQLPSVGCMCAGTHLHTTLHNATCTLLPCIERLQPLRIAGLHSWRLCTASKCLCTIVASSLCCQALCSAGSLDEVRSAAGAFLATVCNLCNARPSRKGAGGTWQHIGRVLARLMDRCLAAAAAAARLQELRQMLDQVRSSGGLHVYVCSQPARQQAALRVGVGIGFVRLLLVLICGSLASHGC